LCNGDANGIIEITASNGMTPYQYSIDNGNTFQNNNIFNNLTNGTYNIVVEDLNGCQATTTADLIEPAALQINISGTDLLCNGDFTGEINATVTGGTPPYLYSIDGNVTTQGSGLYSNIQAGNYTVDVTDDHNCITNGNIIISEPAPLSWTQFTYNSPTCFGDCDITITTQATGGTLPYIYSWSDNIATPNDAIATNVCSGTFSVMLTDDHGCQIDSLNFDIFDPTPIIFDLVTTSVSCHPNNGPNNDGLIDIVIPTQTTPLSQFSFEGGPYQTNTQYTNLLPGLYTVYGQNDNGCTTYYTTNVYQPQELISGVPNDTLVCNGTELIIEADSATGGTVPYVYQWSSNGVNLTQQDSFNMIVTTDSVIDLTVIDSNNCVANYSFQINIPPALTVTASPDQTICSGSSTNISATANGGTPNYSYLWQTGNPNDNTDIINVSPTQDPTQYIIAVTDECNETATDTVLVSLYDNPPLLVIGGGLGCLPYQADLISAGNIVQNGGNVVWNLGDGTTITGQDSVSHLYENEGCYDVTVSVTTVNGCTYDSTFTDLVCINPNPIANFDYVPALPTTSDQVVQFNNLSENAASYFWTFGNLSSSTLENPDFEFNAEVETVYNVCLTAVSDYGCTDTVCYPVTIYEELFFYVPNVFTPDHDNYNEVFQPIFTSGFDPYDYHLTIFNRWGEIVFESYNDKVGWNGTYPDGNLCQDGVYVWQITFGVDMTDERKTVRGHVTLLK
jgi:gliding motility-associated-like protein